MAFNLERLGSLQLHHDSGLEEVRAEVLPTLYSDAMWSLSLSLCKMILILFCFTAATATELVGSQHAATGTTEKSSSQEHADDAIVVREWLKTACNEAEDWGPIPPNDFFQPEFVLAFTRHGARIPCSGGNADNVPVEFTCWQNDTVQYACTPRKARLDIDVGEAAADHTRSILDKKGAGKRTSSTRGNNQDEDINYEENISVLSSKNYMEILFEKEQNSWRGTCSTGELTDAGLRQCRNNGRRLAEAYGTTSGTSGVDDDLHSTTGDDRSSLEVSFFSDESQRVQECGQAMAAEMLVWKEPVNANGIKNAVPSTSEGGKRPTHAEADDSLSPEGRVNNNQHPQEETQATRVLVPARPAANLTWHVLGPGSGLQPGRLGGCLAFGAAVKSWWKESAFLRQKAEQYPELLPQLRAVFGDFVLGKKLDNFRTLSKVMDCVHGHFCSTVVDREERKRFHVPLALEKTLLAQLVASGLAAAKYEAFFEDPHLAKLSAGYFLGRTVLPGLRREVVERLKSSNDEDPKVKHDALAPSSPEVVVQPSSRKATAHYRKSWRAKRFHIYAGHDFGPLGPLLGLLGAEQLSFVKKWPNFASLLVWEFGAGKVRLVYDGKVLPTKVCGPTGVCAAEEFLQKLEALVPSRTECNGSGTNYASGGLRVDDVGGEEEEDVLFAIASASLRASRARENLEENYVENREDSLEMPSKIIVESVGEKKDDHDGAKGSELHQHEILTSVQHGGVAAQKPEPPLEPGGADSSTSDVIWQ
ncbi:unnamed protein product [Amoebophrya sp. A120]|nr:unnamed protein product [Amoebophrya sp. A120]|eukprot:GSA120T00011013001.1